jgi:hypothetical protein
MAAMTKTPERKLHDYISEISERTDVRMGSPLPLGTRETGGGVNFAIFSRYASRVRLKLFDHPEDATPTRIIDLDSARNRAGDVCHVWVEGMRKENLVFRCEPTAQKNKGGYVRYPPPPVFIRIEWSVSDWNANSRFRSSPVEHRRGQPMQIGEPLRTIVVEPLELPVKHPKSEPEPVSVPEPEPAPVQVPVAP